MSAPSTVELDESIGYLISRVRSALWNAVTQQTMSEMHITGSQASILFKLSTGKCLAATELAREYGIDASAVTRLIDRLEKRGLLSRVRSLEDRRVVRLALTAEGHEIATHLPPIFARVMDSMLNGFSLAETDSLRSMLQRIVTNSESGAASARSSV